MFSKLLLIILSAGAIASSLLVLRQQKVETIHDISQAYHRQREYQRTLWLLQAEIAHRCRPEALRDMLERQDENWQPIPALPTSIDGPPLMPPPIDSNSDAAAFLDASESDSELGG